MMAAEMASALIGMAVVVAVLAAVFLGIYQSSFSSSATQAQAATPAQEEDKAEGVGPARRRGNAMQRGMQGRARRAANEQQAAAAARARPADDDDSASASGSGDEEDEDGEQLPMSKKERKKQERREQQEAAAAAQQAREQKFNLKDEKLRAKQEAKDAQRKAQEDEIQRAKDERLQKEEEEAAKWMSMITKQDEGTGEGDDQAEGEGLLSQFIDYIKQRKTVPLEQLATEFKLRTTDVIDRVQGLEAMGHLTGVMDERGKYIYISMEEMEAVARYITNKGRVAIHELAAKSNQFIDLEAKAAEASTGGQPQIDFDALLDVS